MSHVFLRRAPVSRHAACYVHSYFAIRRCARKREEMLHAGDSADAEAR